ncbi:gliding motility-associated ABC transporter permease subunit GldF [Flavobacteriales bacterium]|nr:gliding motility-associated ABC transporter permease subunit GldF [Flavobacteriales bacterium]
MWALLKKEVNSFLNSLIGYIVISVFLLFVGLFMWVLPTEANVIDNGYADLRTLFVVAPWVFLFLIPAITMRSFADEKSSGTIELLHTRPLSDLSIILAKYFGGLTLVIFALLPTLVYFMSVYQLGNPIGNIDTGSVWGSYIGLTLLGASFVSIGIFCSAVSNNQIISFILAVFVSWGLWIGIETIASFQFLGTWDHLLLSIGINSHYSSLSRGVIDTRDVVYLLSLIAVFIALTKTVLESRKW